ncbi:hypothetical protein ACFVDU_04295 [Streptomyces albidoflavus]
MTIQPLPHDTYIDAVARALADIGFDAAHYWTCDSDTRGLYFYLSSAITLTVEDSGIDAGRWPHGLVLTWEWHPGVEEGEAERGPVWLWAKQQRDGSTTEPASLPVDGYANPLQVAAALHELNSTGRAVKARPGQWHSTPALNAAITAWERGAK